MTEITSGPVSNMADSSSRALLTELDAKRKRVRLFPLALVACAPIVVVVVSARLSVWIWILAGAALALLIGYAYYWDLLKKSVVLMYDLSDGALDAYREVHDALTGLARVGGLWHVSARGDVRDPKYHAGASQLMQRKRISVAEQEPPFVRSNVPVIRMPIGAGHLYFCPDTILVYTGDGVGAVPYGELSIECARTRFIEESAVPRDAKVIDRTWRFVNKKGGPDRRFKDNREIPICEYEEIRLRSSSGLNEILQVSRVGLGNQINEAAQRMARALMSIKSAAPSRPANSVTASPRANPIVPPSTRVSPPKPQAPAPPPVSNGARSVVVPSLSDLHDALFDLLCCVMVADGRASTSEKARIDELMRRSGAAWSSEQTAARIATFIVEVQNAGFRSTFERAVERAPLFAFVGRRDVLLKALRSLAEAKDSMSPQESAVLARIEHRLDHAG